MPKQKEPLERLADAFEGVEAQLKELNTGFRAQQTRTEKFVAEQDRRAKEMKAMARESVSPPGPIAPPKVAAPTPPPGGPGVHPLVAVAQRMRELEARLEQLEGKDDGESRSS